MILDARKKDTDMLGHWIEEFGDNLGNERELTALHVSPSI